MLKEKNYRAVKTKIIMQPLRVWSAVEGDGDYNEAKDEEVFTMLSQSVPESLMKGKKTGDHRGDKKNKRGKGKEHRKFDITLVRCYNCNVTGHFQSECPEPKREWANLVEKDDDEPALLLAHAVELGQVVEETGEKVMLHEEKVQPKLPGDMDKD
jgi:hypothetical protein